MFERLFKYPRVLARHREGPLAESREQFLRALRQRRHGVQYPGAHRT